jgi:hypothetical protein
MPSSKRKLAPHGGRLELDDEITLNIPGKDIP